MGIRSSIRNFFYAATHANQLIADNQRMRQELTENSSTITMQTGELRSMEDTQRFMERHQERLETAIALLAPKDLSLDTLRELYISVRDTTYDYEKAGQYLLGHQWFARGYIQNASVWDDIEKEIYRIALDQANILPYEQDFTTQNHLLEQATETISERLETAHRPRNIPVGRIDYLDSYGVVCESLEYRNTGKFVSDALHSNHCGEPMSITVYSDPKTGAHIDASWRLHLDPPPQGFHIEDYGTTNQLDNSPAIQAPAPTPEPEFEIE